MSSGSVRGSQQGFTYVLAMFAVAVAGLLLAATSEIWSQSRQREKEKELLYIGGRFREAIALYYQRTPGSVKRYPEKLEELIEDKRYLSMQRYLRKIHADPMTGNSQWAAIAAPGGGIMGVHSLSDRRPIKSANFDTRDEAFTGSSRYADWKFVYEPPPDSGTTPPQR
ncbi:MAG TPA: type II secretion system protein [Burkholderiales bacterium]|nr:type II secretion system protein [Burkholderiales bacterium]